MLFACAVVCYSIMRAERPWDTMERYPPSNTFKLWSYVNISWICPLTSKAGGPRTKVTNQCVEHSQRKRNLNIHRPQKDLKWTEPVRVSVMFTSVCLGIYLTVTDCLSGVSFGLLLALCHLSPRQPGTPATNSTVSGVSRRWGQIEPHHAHFTVHIPPQQQLDLIQEEEELATQGSELSFQYVVKL